MIFFLCFFLSPDAIENGAFVEAPGPAPSSSEEEVVDYGVAPLEQEVYWPEVEAADYNDQDDYPDYYTNDVRKIRKRGQEKGNCKTELESDIALPK